MVYLLLVCKPTVSFIFLCTCRTVRLEKTYKHHVNFELSGHCPWKTGDGFQKPKPAYETRTYIRHYIHSNFPYLRRRVSEISVGLGKFNNKAVLSQRWPIDAPTKVNKQPHLNLRSHDSQLTQFNSTGRYGRRCWTNIFSPKFLHVPLRVGGWPLGYKQRRCWANCSRN